MAIRYPTHVCLLLLRRKNDGEMWNNCWEISIAWLVQVSLGYPERMRFDHQAITETISSQRIFSGILQFAFVCWCKWVEEMCKFWPMILMSLRWAKNFVAIFGLPVVAVISVPSYKITMCGTRHITWIRNNGKEEGTCRKEDTIKTETKRKSQMSRYKTQDSIYLKPEPLHPYY